jgi:hypothetical protein
MRRRQRISQSSTGNQSPNIVADTVVIFHETGTDQPFPSRWPLLPAEDKLFGRDSDFTRLRDLMGGADEGRPSVIVIRGQPGVGKSALGKRAFADLVGSAFTHGWWLDAHTRTACANEWAAVIGAPPSMIDGTILQRWSGLLNGRWLAVFDGASEPSEIADLIPRVGDGVVLVTTSDSRWRHLGVDHELDVLDVENASAMLNHFAALPPNTQSAELVGELGQLPLAIWQAAGFMTATGSSTMECVDLITRDPEQALAFKPDGLSGSLWEIHGQLVSAIDIESDVAGFLWRVIACAGRGPMPAEFLRRLASAHTSTKSDPTTAALAVLSRHALVRVDAGHVEMHGLVRRSLRARLSITGELVSLSQTVGAHMRELLELIPESDAQRAVVLGIVNHASDVARELHDAGDSQSSNALTNTLVEFMLWHYDGLEPVKPEFDGARLDSLPIGYSLMTYPPTTATMNLLERPVIVSSGPRGNGKSSFLRTVWAALMYVPQCQTVVIDPQHEVISEPIEGHMILDGEEGLVALRWLQKLMRKVDDCDSFATAVLIDNFDTLAAETISVIEQIVADIHKSPRTVAMILTARDPEALRDRFPGAALQWNGRSDEAPPWWVARLDA